MVTLSNASIDLAHRRIVHGEERELSVQVREIIENRRLTAVFQPIVAMDRAEIMGYEGLIRGPSDGPLHAPIALFQAAEYAGLTVELERTCQEIVLETFAALDLPAKLFLNVNPECLLGPTSHRIETLAFMHKLGLSPERVTIELTESQATFDYSLLRESTHYYRGLGFEIAIDDLGEGFSSLRLWSELGPEYVKIDKHFIQRVNREPVKLQFVRSIQHIAENSGARVIAEGIETLAELMIVKDLGVAFGQGFFMAKPLAQPVVAMPAEVTHALMQPGISVYPHGVSNSRQFCAEKLLTPTPPVTPHTSSAEVHKRFTDTPDLHLIAVVRDGQPVGLVSRQRIIESFSQMYTRELYGRKPCERFMDRAPLIVDKRISLQDLSHLVVTLERRYLSEGFIITDHGRYAGTGTGHDLMREITQMQIAAARYANPLTQLPGNVPIDEHIDRLLENQAPFTACYCDLDFFKPFNDRYGYRRGDDLIQLTGRILAHAVDPERDFVGHIGGDDFIILFQSADWEERCKGALTSFDQAAASFFSGEDYARGGYVTEDRRGQEVFHPLTSLSIGAVQVDSGAFATHHDIARVASEAKRQAKKESGSTLFIDRRRHHPIQAPEWATA